MTKDQIQAMTTKDLWAVLCATNAHTEHNCNVLCWARAELRRRGFAVA
jgi:hypothetical protein